jgi:hypothetical protein
VSVKISSQISRKHSSKYKEASIAKRVRSNGSLLDKKRARKNRMLTEEKLDKKGTRSEHTPEITEIHCTRDINLENV